MGKSKGQPRLDNPEKPATLDTQTENEDKHNDNPQYSTEH